MLTTQIAEKFKPEKIVLFGSQAYGTPHADSDVDILVIMPRVISLIRPSKSAWHLMRRSPGTSLSARQEKWK